MDKTLFDQYVQERYNKQMEFYSKSSAKNKTQYSKFQWTLIILSALTPVFAALGSFKTETLWGIDIKSTLSFLVIVVSVVVAILTTGLKTFNYQELWGGYRLTYELLKPEIHYYNFNVGPYGFAGVDKESLFVTRVEGILNSEHVNWPPAKTKKDNNDKAQNDEADAPVADAAAQTAGAGLPGTDAIDPNTPPNNTDVTEAAG